MRRGIEKMRLERAFLLEQVARRVKPNDDSSDGSPSPPPTVGNYPTSNIYGYWEEAWLDEEQWLHFLSI